MHNPNSFKREKIRWKMKSEGESYFYYLGDIVHGVKSALLFLKFFFF